MLERYVCTQAGRRRHAATPIGPHLDGFAIYLERQGFAFRTIQNDMKTATAFGEYLSSEGMRVVELSEDDIHRFVQSYRSTPRLRGPRRTSPGGSHAIQERIVGSLRKLFRFLRSTGCINAKGKSTAQVPHGGLLTDYLEFLEAHRGFAARTVAGHAQRLEALLRKLGERSPGFRMESLTSEDVESATAEVVAAGSGTRRTQMIHHSVDAFVRHLRDSGRISPTCRPFFLRRRRYALAALPPAIEWKEVERAVASIDRTTAHGRRDFAIVTLCATYGLRTSEVAGLRLEDIDWRRGALRIRQFKTHRELDLPLVQPVADALVAYLRDGRPEDADRHVFQKLHAPRGPITNAATYQVVRKALIGAGIEAPQYGPHLLRHARATSLVRQGNSIKTVGDLLGHRVPEATIIYCKLAVEDLREVALELPEVTP